ncbi:MAG TPA: adenylate/guanylate cyclase domain-containing protein [Bryobacteraceae bacterium]|nr:adenylate/guanylate cyclase domain-containing protein [Bryobacteraceae bacterium]
MKFWLRSGLRVVASVAIVCAILAVEFRFRGIQSTTVNYSLLLAILYFAVRWDRLETIIASAVAALGFLYYFQPPVGSLKASDPQSYVEVAAFLITALVVSQTALAARKRAAEAVERKRDTERLYELSQAMLASESLQTTAWIATNQAMRIFGASGAAFYLRASGEFQRAGESELLSDDTLRAAAVPGAAHVDTQALLAIVPVLAGEEVAGSFGICGAALPETVLKSIGSLLSAVLLRVHAAEELVAANRALEQRHKEVEQQKKISESLLLNILPGEVADELRVKGMVSPKYFEDVTILFTDFVGFTLSTEKLAAEELVELLHDYFTAFDQIVSRYKLEKMKTIGDSYMCISGLPVRNPAHPVDMVMAAFEMLHEVQLRQQRESARWKVRIGIHTGPVIAGVVGINKFAFDIWGDTVNYSSRMESSGEANRINLSERTYSRVKDFFACEYRGKVITKEKRELDMYFANGILPALLNGPGQIPPAFTRRYSVYFQKDPPAFPAFLNDGAREAGEIAPAAAAPAP